MKEATLKAGWGYYRTDVYPIGGEFRRACAGSLPVLLTGKRLDSGCWAGYVEFIVPAGVNGGKEYSGYTKEDGIQSRA